MVKSIHQLLETGIKKHLGIADESSVGQRSVFVVCLAGQTPKRRSAPLVFCAKASAVLQPEPRP